MNEMLSYDQAAEVLNVPKGTLYAMVSQRRVPHVRLGPRLVRFRRSDLENWVRAQEVVVEPAEPVVSRRTRSVVKMKAKRGK